MHFLFDLFVQCEVCRGKRYFKWCWQRDFFDHANAGAVFGAMMKNDQLSNRMQERMKAGSRMPGWTKREDFDWFSTLEDPDA